MFSWLVNEALGNLPLWLWPAVAGGGFTIYLLAGILVHIPEVKPYAIFVKPVAMLAMACGIFMYGGAGVTEIYQEKIKEAEAKVDTAKELSKAGNVEVHTVYVDRVKVVHDKQIVVQQQIKEVEKKINADCHIDPEAIQILNNAAGGSK